MMAFSNLKFDISFADYHHVYFFKYVSICNGQFFKAFCILHSLICYTCWKYIYDLSNIICTKNISSSHRKFCNSSRFITRLFISLISHFSVSSNCLLFLFNPFVAIISSTRKTLSVIYATVVPF